MKRNGWTRLDPDFWANASPVPFAGCLIWVRSVNTGGYGIMVEKGKGILAHRRAWELTHGSIPPGLKVLHRCDTPPCINPEHLFIGTQSDNMRDAYRKGRTNMAKAWVAAGEKQKGKTTCPQGHPYDTENTYIYKVRNTGSVRRFCRACTRVNGMKHYYLKGRDKRRLRVP